MFLDYLLNTLHAQSIMIAGFKAHKHALINFGTCYSI